MEKVGESMTQFAPLAKSIGQFCAHLLFGVAGGTAIGILLCIGASHAFGNSDSFLVNPPYSPILWGVSFLFATLLSCNSRTLR